MKILHIDDHALFRRGLALLLSTAFDDIEVVGVSNLRQAIDLIGPDSDFDMVMLDLQMPEQNPLDGLDAIRAHAPELPVIVVTGSDASTDVRGALARGAKGFVCKSSAPNDIWRAVSRVAAGEIFLSADARTLLPTPDVRRSAALPDTLTPRQKQVMGFLVNGTPYKVVAHNLGVSMTTVKTDTMAIYRKLGVNNRTQAVVAAARMGYAPQALAG